MPKNNPSRAARAFVLSGPALAVPRHGVLPRAAGAGVGFIRGIWFGAALWSQLHVRSRASCGGGFMKGTGPPSNATNSPTGAASGSTGQPGRDATHGAADLEEQELHGHDPGP